MATISILANTVRPSVDGRSDDAAFGAGLFSWQEPVHSWKAGPGEVMTEENLLGSRNKPWAMLIDFCTFFQWLQILIKMDNVYKIYKNCNWVYLLLFFQIFKNF